MSAEAAVERTTSERLPDRPSVCAPRASRVPARCSRATRCTSNTTLAPEPEGELARRRGGASGSFCRQPNFRARRGARANDLRAPRQRATLGGFVASNAASRSPLAFCATEDRARARCLRSRPPLPTRGTSRPRRVHAISAPQRPQRGRRPRLGVMHAREHVARALVCAMGERLGRVARAVVEEGARRLRPSASSGHRRARRAHAPRRRRRPSWRSRRRAELPRIHFSSTGPPGACQQARIAAAHAPRRSSRSRSLVGLCGRGAAFSIPARARRTPTRRIERAADLHPPPTIKASAPAARRRGGGTPRCARGAAKLRAAAADRAGSLRRGASRLVARSPRRRRRWRGAAARLMRPARRAAFPHDQRDRPPHPRSGKMRGSLHRRRQARSGRASPTARAARSAEPPPRRVRGRHGGRAQRADGRRVTTWRRWRPARAAAGATRRKRRSSRRYVRGDHSALPSNRVHDCVALARKRRGRRRRRRRRRARVGGPEHAHGRRRMSRGRPCRSATPGQSAKDAASGESPRDKSATRRRKYRV